MATSDVSAFGNQSPANWRDPFLDLLNQWAPTPDKNWARGVVEGGNRYLSGLSPDQLVERYRNLSPVAGNDFSGYEMRNYGQGNANDATNYSAYQAFKSLIGRDPTASEFAQVLPAFQGPNGIMTGRAALANLQQMYKSDPRMDPGNASNNRNPQDISGSVSQQFQSILGRPPTKDELEHFGQAIQANQIDAYGLSSFLKQQPEYTNARDKEFRTGLSDELSGYDQKAFGRMKDDVIADYGRRGVSIGSSPSLDFAITDLMGQMAEKRGNYLSQLSASQYGGNKDLAIGNYKGILDEMTEQNRQRRQQLLGYNDKLTDRGFAGADYVTQRDDYMRFLESQRGGKQKFPWGQVIGGAVGAGIGGFASRSPQGAQAGYQIGSGLGGGYDYLNY